MTAALSIVPCDVCRPIYVLYTGTSSANEHSLYNAWTARLTDIASPRDDAVQRETSPLPRHAEQHRYERRTVEAFCRVILKSRTYRLYIRLICCLSRFGMLDDEVPQGDSTKSRAAARKSRDAVAELLFSV